MATQVSVFHCPNCREFVASDASSCRFCSTPLYPEMIRKGVEAQAREDKKYRRDQYMRHMLLGAGLFFGGLLLTGGSIVLALTTPFTGGYGILLIGMMLAGIGDFLYGLYGWLGELRGR